MNNNPTEARQEIEPGSANLRERVQALTEKTAALNESLSRVKENLREASGESADGD